MPFVMDKSKSEKGLQYKRSLPYITEVKWDISVLPFVRNTIINIKVHVVPHLCGKNNLVFSYLYFLSSNVQVLAFTKKAFSFINKSHLHRRDHFDPSMGSCDSW